MNTSQALDRLGTLSSLMNVGVMLLDTAAEVEFANSIACELLGCAGDAEAGVRWKSLKQGAHLDPERIAGTPSPMHCVAEGGGRDAARSLRLEIHTLAHSECDGYLVLLRDRRTLDALEENLLLATQMRSVAHFHRALAHDLRTPLNSMQLTLDLLAETEAETEAGSNAGRASRARHERHMAVLREELARLSGIVRTALDRSEPLDLMPSTFDLRELLREASRLVGPQARRQRVEIDLRLPEQAAIMTGYRDRIRQALINLILSGLDAMPEGGGVHIELAVKGGAASVAMRSTANGMGAVDHIYRVHPAGGKRDGEIALYVTRLIVESHGGEVATEGGPGKGARLSLTLPLGERMPQAGRPRVPDRARSS